MLSEAEFFREITPTVLRRALFRVVMDGCVKARSLAAQHDKNFFVDAVQSHRRLAVEAALSNLILPEGFTSEVVRTPSTHYTKISSNRVTITAVTRAQEPDYVRPYNYRANLARANQMSIFALMPGAAVKERPDEQLYALLVYGGPHKLQLPTIAKIVFPMPSGMVPRDCVDLFEDHEDLAVGYRQQHGGDLPEAKPKLRKKPAAKEA